MRRLRSVAWLGVFALTGVLSAQDKPAPDPNRPVAVYVLDFGNDGFQLTSAADGVMFDIDGTGTPVRTGWTIRDGNLGFLFLDTNGNSRVDSGRELLGNGWRSADGSRVISGDTALVEIQGFTRGMNHRTVEVITVRLAAAK